MESDCLNHVTRFRLRISRKFLETLETDFLRQMSPNLTTIFHFTPSMGFGIGNLESPFN